MKRILSIMVMAALVAACITDASAQGRRRVTASNNYVTRTVSGISDFTAISARGIADVEYTQSNGAPSVTIYGADNVLEYLKVSVSGGVLNVTMENGVDIRGESRLKVIASSRSLTKVNTTGTGDIKFKSALSTGDFDIVTSGTGDVEFSRINSTGTVSISVSGTGDIEGNTLKANSINARISGTGDMEISNIEAGAMELSVSGTGDAEVGGRVNELKLKVGGTGSVDAGSLMADTVNASVSGTGSVYCYPVKALYGTESGTGSLKYKGEPQTVDIKGNKRRVVRRND